MHKLIHFFHRHPQRSKNQIIFFCLVLFWLGIPAIGQTKTEDNVPSRSTNATPTNQPQLPDKLGSNWRALEAQRRLNAEQCQVLPDGDVYAEYDLQSLTTRFYTNGKTKIAVELFQTRFPSEAYGLFTFIRHNRNNKHQGFYVGNLVITASGESEGTLVEESVIKTLRESIVVEEGELPSLPFNLPEQGKIAGTERYVIGPLALAKTREFSDLKDAINFIGGTHAVIADYHNGNGQMTLMIVEYHTPQLATDGQAQLQSYFDNLPQQEKSSRLLKRIGNYVTLTTNIQNMPVAESVIAQIKYSPKVYWEGKNLNDVPIQFRPPDPIAVEEASQTAKMLIRTFYWIGVMIFAAIAIGFLVGGSYFYWNRYRRRKLGIDNLFSDAGGTVRLNLDEYLLQPGETSIKRITEEKKR